MFYFENVQDALWLLSFHFLPGSICSVEIDAVQLTSKTEVLRKDSAVARRAAPGPLRRSWAPGGDGFIRAAAISSGDHGRNASGGNKA